MTIRTVIALDGRFPLRAVYVSHLDDPSVQQGLAPDARHERKFDGSPNDSGEGVARRPERLADIVADLYDEVWSCEFDAHAFDTYFSNDSRAMAKANRALMTLRSGFTEDEWESILTPIDEKWRDRFAKLPQDQDDEPNRDSESSGNPDD